jgi:hypothetical protein
LCVLCFLYCFVYFFSSCIVTSFLSVYKFTDNCHRVETPTAVHKYHTI